MLLGRGELLGLGFCVGFLDCLVCLLYSRILFACRLLLGDCFVISGFGVLFVICVALVLVVVVVCNFMVA